MKKLNLIKTSLKTLVAGLVLAAVLAAPTTTIAQYAPYGGQSGYTQTKQLSVNKLVKHPKLGVYVENAQDGYTYLNGQEIGYRIEVTNSGQANLTNITVVDRLPSEITFVSGTGIYDNNARTLTINIDSLNAGETKVYEYKAKATIVTDKGGNLAQKCPVNTVEVRSGDLYATDKATVCIGEKVLGTMIELPVTGLSATQILAISIAMFMAAFVFSRLASIKK